MKHILILPLIGVLVACGGDPTSSFICPVTFHETYNGTGVYTNGFNVGGSLTSSAAPRHFNCPQTRSTSRFAYQYGTYTISDNTYGNAGTYTFGDASPHNAVPVMQTTAPYVANYHATKRFPKLIAGFLN